jgi:hypothetical protein
MEDFKKIFEDKKKEFQKDNLIIKEVPIAEIQKLNKDFVDGCFNAIFSNNQYERFEILIDESLEYDQKISVLFHEMGHVKLYESLGFAMVNVQRTKNKDNWQVNSEFHAFKNQLEEGKKLFESGVTSMLPIVVKSINDTYKNTSLEPAYNEAIKDIFRENIWVECILLIEKNDVEKND